MSAPFGESKLEHFKLTQAPQTKDKIQSQDAKLLLPTFNANTAFSIGVYIRDKIQVLFPGQAAQISIATTNNTHILFQCATDIGTTPDNDSWVARKRRAVERWGLSTWHLRAKYNQDEALFRSKIGPGAEMYAVHGGGFPVYLQADPNLLVGTIIVSGLVQESDHMVIVESLIELFHKEEREEILKLGA